MDYECLQTLADFASIILAGVAIVVSIGTYVHGIKKERRADTLKCLTAIRTQYFNSQTLDEKEKLKYLNQLEYFATGVNARVYDVSITNKMSGGRLIKQYDNWIKDFIVTRREKYGNDKTYSEYEKMIRKLKRKRGIKRVS